MYGRDSRLENMLLYKYRQRLSVPAPLLHPVRRWKLTPPFPVQVHSCFVSRLEPVRAPADHLVRWNPPIRCCVSARPLPIAGTGVTTDTSFIWTVNATLGQSLVLLVTDDEGQGLHIVSSASFNVIPGAGDGCINGN
ncbi:hypothetical protein MVEN_00012200 [Mycena venus]|uniref:Uncharacterized protein n=1 Tax=Mycena venus TaxID=2733690 RepID=A0A8H6Z6N1_9AGAR|nr:hypothetical protein MVEN_00012200 [Mycena venus]